MISGVVMATLAPSAFLKLAEDASDHEMTGEMQMLEASREEIRKVVPANARGLARLGQSLWVFWYCYIYDPIATGFRFIHLAVIFLPVIATVPAIWVGRRLQNRNGARTGTLWWYQFLVKAMERAGPAFIKVSYHRTTSTLTALLTSWNSARTMGRLTDRYLPPRNVQCHVLASFECPRPFTS